MKVEYSRRALLVHSGGWIAAGVLAHRPLAAQDIAWQKELITRTVDPRNAEPALEHLVQSWITPTKYFYVRSHAPNPKIDPSTFRLSVEGLVRKPLRLSLADLARYGAREVTATLTCAGNRRAEFNAEGEVGGVQWQAGAIGNARWSGIALSDVLRQAEVLETARHVWFEGLDEIERDHGTIPFGASIPIEKAMAEGDVPGALLVDKMNGSVLTPDHGFPLRTIVPGYIGARSVKWLGKIVVSDSPSPNHYVRGAYKIVRQTDPIDWAESGPIYRYPINVAICQPSPSAELAAGRIEVTGYVLPSGLEQSRVKRVFVSSDDGQTWVQAEMSGTDKSYCWQLWTAQIDIGAKSTELLVRAVDTTGGFTPARVPWNAKGYLQNSWYRTAVNVKPRSD